MLTKTDIGKMYMATGIIGARPYLPFEKYPYGTNIWIASEDVLLFLGECGSPHKLHYYKFLAKDRIVYVHMSASQWLRVLDEVALS